MMIRSYRLGCACVALLLVVGLARGTAAAGGSAVEDLTKRLPDNVVGLVATSGGDALKDDFARTAASRIWNDPGVQSFYRSVRTELLGQLRRKAGDPNLPQKVEDALQYARLALSRPVVLGIAEAQVKDGPPVCAFAIVNAGPRKAELTAALGKVEAMAGEGVIVDRQVGSLKMRGFKEQEDVPLYWGWVEDYLVVALNDAQGTAAQYVVSPRAAAAVALGKVPAGDDALVVYWNCPKLSGLIDSLIQQGGGPKEAGALAAAAKSLGFGNAGTLIARAGFAGADLVVDGLLEMPSPPAGIFAAYKPVDPSWLGAVDARAMTACAVNLDVTAMYDMILNAVKTASPDEGYPEMQKGIAALESEAKVRIRDGLLGSLAGPAVFYTLPAGMMTEAPRGGFVAVARLKDAPQFERAMTALGDFAGAKSQGMLQISSLTRDDGRIVHVWTVAPLALMSVMPTWSVVSDHVVIGSNKELCDMGVKLLASKGADTKSLPDSDAYKKAAAGLPKDLVSLSYTDSRVQLDQTMIQIQQFWPMLTMVAMQSGVKLPVVLPSLTEISKDLTPSCGYRYWSPEGLRHHYRGPGIEVSQMSLGGAAVGAGVLLPAMAKARDQARRAASMSHLKQIGLGLLMYADDHGNKLPDDLKSLGPYKIDSNVLESPRKPKDFAGPSYIYIPGQTTSTAPDSMVVYENPAFCPDGVNVLFMDGHVEFMKPEAFRSALEATCKRLGRPAP